MPSHTQILSTILTHRIIAVLRLDSDRDATDICEALIEGGITVLEVTMTTPGALKIIERLAARQDLLVGAGTVLDAETARWTFESGAAFFASPAFDCATIERARSLGRVAIPGASTPTEILQASRCGADIIKLFPMPADGVRALKTLRGPFPSLRFAPSGGVTDLTARQLLDAGAAALNVGTWLTHDSNGAPSSLRDITARARSLVAAVTSA